MVYWRCIDCYSRLGLTYKTSHPYTHTHRYMSNGMAWHDWSLINTIKYHMILNMMLLCTSLPWWRYQMETFPRYWPFVRGIHRSPVKSPHKTPRCFDVFFDLRLNKRLSKQSWGWWFMTPSHILWRHCNDEEWPCMPPLPKMNEASFAKYFQSNSPWLFFTKIKLCFFVNYQCLYVASKTSEQCYNQRCILTTLSRIT